MFLYSNQSVERGMGEEEGSYIRPNWKRKKSKLSYMVVLLPIHEKKISIATPLSTPLNGVDH